MRRLVVLMLAAVLAGCGGDDDVPNTLPALLENSKSASVKITYTNADGSFAFVVSQTGPDYLAFFAGDEKFVSTPDGIFDCFGMGTAQPTCEEIPEAELEFTAFGPSTVISLQDLIAAEPEMLEGSPVEIEIANRVAQCYSVDPDRLLPGSDVVDPDARVCLDPGSGWVLEVSAVGEASGVYFRATDVASPEGADYELPL